jgi:Protein of unknown function (DUF1566)/IPTL-CTERM motif
MIRLVISQSLLRKSTMIYSNRLLALCLATVLLWCSAPAQAAFIVNVDGTVTDSFTGLVWDQCHYGRTGANCDADVDGDGYPDTGMQTSFAGALSAAVSANAANYKGHNDWRLPNIKELESIVDLNNSPSIDKTAFPNTDGSDVWSSTSGGFDGNGQLAAYAIYFQDGSIDLGAALYWHLRLVRGGQAFQPFDALATPQAQTITPVPTLSEWAMVLMLVLMAGAAVLGLRRRG